MTALRESNGDLVSTDVMHRDLLPDQVGIAGEELDPLPSVAFAQDVFVHIIVEPDLHLVQPVLPIGSDDAHPGGVTIVHEDGCVAGQDVVRVDVADRGVVG